MRPRCDLNEGRKNEGRKSRDAREVGPMKTVLLAAGIGTAIAFAVFTPDAGAQEVTKFSCQAIGANGAPEPLGDREGHGISVATVSCRDVGGVLDGALTTGQEIWEWDGTNAKLLAESGVVRKPGAMAIYVLTE